MNDALAPIRWESIGADGAWRPIPDHLVSGSEPRSYVAAPEPVALCAGCLYTLASHVDGLCGDGGTYRFLPLGRFAGRIWRDVADSWGAHLYVFTLGGCFDPPVYTVRGDSWEDAYEWFLDYCADRGLIDDRTDYLDDDERAAWDRGDRLDGLEMVDGHAGIFDTSDVNGWQVR